MRSWWNDLGREFSYIRRVLNVSYIISIIGRFSGPATVIGAILALLLTGFVGSLQDRPMLTAAASSGAITLIITSFAIILTYARTRDSLDFFGFRRDREFVIVLPTFHYRLYKNAVHPDYPEGPYKLSRVKKGADLPAVGLRVTSYGDLILVNSLLKGDHSLLNVGISLIMDEEVAAGGELSAPFYDDDKPLICFGSEQFNDLARLILDNMLTESGGRAITFQGTSEMVLHPDLGVIGQGQLLASSDEIDYAVLGKVVLNPEGHPVTTFLCAGIDAPGTRILISSLFVNWKDLRRQVGDGEFFAIYKLMKRDYERYLKARVFIQPISNTFFFRDELGHFVASSRQTCSLNKRGIVAQ